MPAFQAGDGVSITLRGSRSGRRSPKTPLKKNTKNYPIKIVATVIGENNAKDAIVLEEQSSRQYVKHN